MKYFKSIFLALLISVPAFADHLGNSPSRGPWSNWIDYVKDHISHFVDEDDMIHDKIGAIQSDVMDVQSDLMNVQTEIDLNSTHITSVQGDLTVAETEIDRNSTDIGGLISDTTNLLARIDVLENSVGSYRPTAVLDATGIRIGDWDDGEDGVGTISFSDYDGGYGDKKFSFRYTEETTIGAELDGVLINPKTVTPINSCDASNIRMNMDLSMTDNLWIIDGILYEVISIDTSNRGIYSVVDENGECTYLGDRENGLLRPVEEFEIQTIADLEIIYPIPWQYGID